MTKLMETAIALSRAEARRLLEAPPLIEREAAILSELFPVPVQTTGASRTVDAMALHGEATAGESLEWPNPEQSGPVSASRTGGATPPTGAK